MVHPTSLEPHNFKSSSSHVPVLLKEVIQALEIKEGETFVDGTYGRGGYSQAILEEKANTTVWALDRDPEAVVYGQMMEESFKGRFKIRQSCFGVMGDILSSQGISSVDGIVLDIGVSSSQIEDPDRGFSFRYEGPLDMRMSQEGQTAADVVNTAKEEDLAHIIFTLGEERFSRRIARKIVEFRRQKSFETTKELADVVRAVVPRPKNGIDPATRTFQALRIYVNDELNALERGLTQSKSLLKVGGRLVVVSFHSLEDRCVKNFMRRHAQEGQQAVSRYAPPQIAQGEPLFEIITRRAITPGEQECRLNPRARSAKLRAARRLSTLNFEERRIHP